MRRLLWARTVLAMIGILVWGYGANIEDPKVRLLGIAILAVALVLRFFPKRWLE